MLIVMTTKRIYYQEGNRIRLSKEANDSIITLIRQHPEAQVKEGDHYDRYGKGKMCSSLEVNNRTIFDCVESDFSHMPTPFRNIMRLFASKDVQGHDLLLILDKSKDFPILSAQRNTLYTPILVSFLFAVIFNICRNNLNYSVLQVVSA